MDGGNNIEYFLACADYNNMGVGDDYDPLAHFYKVDELEVSFDGKYLVEREHMTIVWTPNLMILI